MRLKLNNQQIKCLIVLMSAIDLVPFSTGYERELTLHVLKRFNSKLKIRALSDKKITSIELEEDTICALNYVMSNIGGFEIFQPLIASELNLIFSQVNKHYVGRLRFQENLITLSTSL